MKPFIRKHWKPIIAGILNIIMGLAWIAYVIFAYFGYGGAWQALIWIPIAIIPLTAGICALKRRFWWVALIGSILGLFPISLIAVILIALSKNEFK